MDKPIAKLLAHPWAIMGALFEAGVAVYTARLMGDESPVAIAQVVLPHGQGADAAVAAVQTAQSQEKKPYAIVDGAAIIPVEGVLTKRPMMLNLCEETTGTANVMAWFQDAMANPQVEDVILYIDSPGGSVDGTQVFADAIFNARGQKPVTAYIDGLGASAAMWIAAQADRIVASSPTTIVGSIGVVATHVDTSKREEAQGVKITEITAGEFKRAYSSHKPLDETGVSVIKERVDAIYSEFVGSIARARGVDAEHVDSAWGQGREFLAARALSLGLIDSIQEFGALLTSRRAIPSGATATIHMENPMDKTETPGALPEAGVQAPPVDQTAGNSQVDVAAAERTRIRGIFDAMIPGHEALARSLAFEQGATIEQAQAAFLAAERAKIEAAAPTPTTATGVETDPLRARWDSNASLRNLYGSFEAYQEAQAALAAAEADGRVRIKSK